MYVDDCLVISDNSNLVLNALVSKPYKYKIKDDSYLKKLESRVGNFTVWEDQI